MNNKLDKLVKLIAVTGFLLILIGTSYSFFTYLRVSDKKNQLIAGDIYMNFIDGTDTIDLINAFPETKEEALARDDNIFTFTIKGKNTTLNKNIWYEIKVNNADDIDNKTRFKPNEIKFHLIESINGIDRTVIDGLSYEDFNNRKIWANKVPLNTSEEISITYKMRMWISDTVSISDTDPFASYTTEEFKNMYANIKLSVYGDFIDKTFPADISLKKMGLTLNNASEGCPVEGEKIKWTNEKQNLLCPYNDNEGPSYYFRGAATRNYVKWGGFYWRIIRINGDGGVRMIYAGDASIIDSLPNKQEVLANGYDDKKTKYTQIGRSFFNANADNNTYVGFMHNTKPLKNIYKIVESELITTKPITTLYISWDNQKYETYWRYGTGYVINDENNFVNIVEEREVRIDDDINHLDVLIGKYVILTSYPSTKGNKATYGSSYNPSPPLFHVTSVDKKNKTLSGHLITLNFADNLNIQETYQKTHSNEEKSDILKILEGWYKKNIHGKSYENQLKDSTYCADRSLYNPYYGKKNSYISYENGVKSYLGTKPNSDYGIGMEETSYATTYRISSKKPSLKCIQKNDIFSVNNESGNRSLTYPIGLINMDEIILADIGDFNYSPLKNFYIQSGISFWTMSPSAMNRYASVYFVDQYGYQGLDVDVDFGVRPVINLDLDKITLSGTGTWDNPYREAQIEYDSNGGTFVKPTILSSNTITSEKPNKVNQEFLGWSESKNSQTITYLSGANHEFKSNKILYAVYRDKKDSEMTLSELTLKKLKLAVNTREEGCPIEGSRILEEDKKALLCPYNDDDGESYYFRGIPINNYVKWGGFYWRIIRINGDGSIRMIYNGKADIIDGLTNKQAVLANGYNDAKTKYTKIGTNKINSNLSNNAYIGLMYGATLPDVYDSKGILDNEITVIPVEDQMIENRNEYEFYWQYGTDYNFDSKNGNVNFSGKNNVRFDDNIDNLDVLVGKYILLNNSLNIDKQKHTIIYGNIEDKFNYIYLLAKVESINKNSKNLNVHIINRTLKSGLNVNEAYKKTHANEVKSEILKILETWYENNISGKPFENQLSDSIYCNDRSLYKDEYGRKEQYYFIPLLNKTYSGISPNSGLGIGTETTGYGGDYRLWNFRIPSLKCLQKNDRFTVNNDKGNKALTYSIGLITGDEIILAGSIEESYGTKNYYLRTGYDFWTMTPNMYGYFPRPFNFHTRSSGYLNSHIVSDPLGIRPVLSINPTNLNVSGIGTWDSPFTFSN